MSLYVVSDIHGYRDDFVAALAREGLADASGTWSGGDSQLWILGDLVDRGPDGIGVVDLVMSLQEQAPEQVHVLMGNHEILALGRARFPDSEFGVSWRYNGGQERDQAALTPRHLEWLASLPLLARVDPYLFMHSDTTAYLGWGGSVTEINRTVATSLASEKDYDAHWDVWARLTSRGHFTGPDGPTVAREWLRTLGGEGIVHGHSIIGMYLDIPSPQVSEPLLYNDGLVLDIDGGRYDGGPLLLVELE